MNIISYDIQFLKRIYYPCYPEFAAEHGCWLYLKWGRLLEPIDTKLESGPAQNSCEWKFRKLKKHASEKFLALFSIVPHFHN